MIRSTRPLSFILLCVFCTNTSLAGNQKVLLIGLDGIRGDLFNHMLNEDPNDLPHLRSLFEGGNGLYSPQATTSDLTGSWGGWSDVLRGVYRDEHEAGYWGSGGVQNVNPSPSHPDLVGAPGLFERLETYNGSLNTVSYITWSNLHDSMDSSSSSPTIDRGADLRNFTDYNSNGDNVVTSQAVSYLSASSGGVSTNDPDVILFYQADTDIAGHNNGFGPESLNTDINDFNTGYINEIIETDDNVGQVLSAINNRPGVISGTEEWLIIATSDHGGTGGGHSQNEAGERRVPFIVGGINTSVVHQTPTNNPMFVKPKNVDVVPTILDHLNIPTNDAAWNGLRGHVVGQTASTQPTIGTNTNLVFNGDAEHDRGFNGHDETIKTGGSKDPERDWSNEGLWWDQDISGWDDWSQTPHRNSMTTVFYGAGEDFVLPTVAGPGPASRGDNFFSGGIDGGSTMTQVIDVSSFSTSGLGFEMSAYLGGFESDNDRADFTVRFLDSGGSEISSFTLTGLDAAGRSNQTGLFFQDLSGAMPTGVDSIEFLLETVGNDGYADNLSFEITDTITLTGDFDDDLDIDGDDWVLYVAGLGSSTPGETDLTGDGMNNHADFIRFKQLYENFNGIGSFAEMLAGVPEPSSFVLLLVGSFGCWFRRSRDYSPIP